jgi:hypothetical protein
MGEGAHLGLALNAEWLGDERIPGVLKGAQRVSNDLSPSCRLCTGLSTTTKLMKSAEHSMLMLKTLRDAARGTSLLQLLQSLIEMMPVVQGVKALSCAPTCLLLLLHILPDLILMPIIEAGAPECILKHSSKCILKHSFKCIPKHGSMLLTAKCILLLYHKS